MAFTNFKTDKPVAVFNVVNTEANPVPPAFLAAAERALTDALSTGELGYPMMNVQARILDAKFDPQLSSDDAFVAAAIKAYREATRGQRAAARTDHEGDGDDAERVPGQRPGRPDGAAAARSSAGVEPRPATWSEVMALVPLEKLFTYANEVRSLSQGRAAASIEPHSYEEAPDEVLRQLRGE